MRARVAVFDALPVFRLGVLTCLEDNGFEAETPDDVLRWTEVQDRAVALLSVCEPPDWDLLADLCHRRVEVVVIALLDKPTVPAYLRALSAGAAAVVPRAATPKALRDAVEAVLDGTVILPVTVLRAMASQLSAASTTPTGDPPTPAEIEWLRQLVQGSTVAQVAKRAGYSERMMFRLLHDIYERLGTSNRTEALIRARDRGWI